MGAAKKYKKYNVEQENNAQDKELIKQYQEKIQHILETDEKVQKKAALILEKLINSDTKKK